MQPPLVSGRLWDRLREQAPLPGIDWQQSRVFGPSPRQKLCSTAAIAAVARLSCQPSLFNVAQGLSMVVVGKQFTFLLLVV